MFRSLLILTLPALMLTAQAGPPPDNPWGGARKEQIIARLHKMRADKLQQLLGLPADKANTIADRWAQLDQDSMEPRMRMRQIHEQVNSILMGPLPEDEKNAKIKPLVEQFTTLRQQQQDRKKQFEEDVCVSLTPAQHARFIMVTEQIQHDLMEAIRDLRKGQPVTTP